jgi:ribonuclease E
VADDELNQELPESPLQWQPPAAEAPELPERLRVHTLARALGTTSRRVLEALTKLDGRSRSAQSSVDQAEATRVRELLAAESDPTESDPAESVAGAQEPQTPQEPRTQYPDSPATPEAPAAVESAAYMPLFVAPQPVVPAAADADADADDDVDDDEDEDLADGDSAGVPPDRLWQVQVR